MTRTLSKLDSITRENLLINSDFRSGIINQKGQTFFENNEYSKVYVIDMWANIHSWVSTNFINLGYINIGVAENSEGYFMQTTENGLPAGIYAVTINVTNINRGTLKLYLEQAQPVHEETINRAGLHTFIFKTTSKATGLSLKLDNFYGDIQYIKLEQGSSFTGMSARNYALELIKCWNKYRYELNNYYTIYSTNNEKCVVAITHNCMNKIPTVKVLGGFGRGSDGYSAQFVSYRVVTSKLNTTTVEVTFNKNITGNLVCLNIEIDAYDY